jgi:hypothetical protein
MVKEIQPFFMFSTNCYHYSHICTTPPQNRQLSWYRNVVLVFAVGEKYFYDMKILFYYTSTVHCLKRPTTQQWNTKKLK